MKKVLVCGMLLGLLTSVSFAQRGRTMGGFGPTARGPSPTATTPPMTAHSPDSVIPGSVLSNTTHAPTATTVGKDPNARPNATFSPTAVPGQPNTARPTNGSTLPDVRSPDIPER